MPTLKAILFDADGTLSDTREVIYTALNKTFAKYGITPPSREQLAPYIHHHHHVHAAFAAGLVSQEDFDATYFEASLDRLAASPLYPGIKALLEELHASGYCLGIVSGASYLDVYIHKNKLAQYFDVVVGADDIQKFKPDPESVQTALKRLAVQPHEAIMLGDLPTDIQTARAASLAASVGITHGFGSRESLQAAGADYIIDSLAELPEVVRKIELESKPLTIDVH